MAASAVRPLSIGRSAHARIACADPLPATWNIGSLTALGIGVGAALAASMGSAGFAVGLAVAYLPLGVRALYRRHRL